MFICTYTSIVPLKNSSTARNYLVLSNVFFLACSIVRSETSGTGVIRKPVHSPEELSHEARYADTGPRPHRML